MHRSRVILGVVLAVLLAAVPGVSASHVLPQTGSSTASALPLTTDAAPIPNGAHVRPLAPATPVSLTFTLTNPHAVALDRFLAQVESPSSPDYRQFVTYPEFVRTFAPPESSVGSVEGALRAAGANYISSTPDRSAVSTVLPAGGVDRLLGVELVAYGTAGRAPLYTAVGSVSLPASLRGVVSGVSGLSDGVSSQLFLPVGRSGGPPEPFRAAGSDFVHVNNTNVDWYVGSDFTQAYDASALLPGPGSVPNATYPKSVAIATLLASAYNGTANTNLPPWDPAVVDAYFNSTLAPNWPLPSLRGVPVTVNNVTPPLPGSFGALNDTSALETENSLDLEMAGSLAPGASLYNFYFAGSELQGSTTVGDAANYLAADLAAALAYNYSPVHLATVSCSFGVPDLNNSLWNAELLTAAATGVTILSASGDQGDAPNSLTNRGVGQWPLWPATAATNVSGAVSVGGVSVTLSGQANGTYNGSALNLSYDPEAGWVSSATAWYDTSSGPGSYVGSEGGTSPVYPEPSWQFHSAAQPAIVNATVREGASALGRAGPDLAMPANSTLATVAANSTGTIFFVILEGTSVAAPVLAGLLADVVAVENNGSSASWTSLGFIDPEVYRFASYFASDPSSPANPLPDVTAGCNYVFCAAPGWDAVTGWGGVNASRFLAADRNATLLDYVYNGSTPGLPPVSSSSGPNVPWVDIYAIFGAGFLIAIVLILVTARPHPARPGATGVPWGARQDGTAPPLTPRPPGTYPGATFLCPYCGAVRPAEPVRCPQ